MQKITCNKCKRTLDEIAFKVDTNTITGYSENCMRCNNDFNPINYDRQETLYKAYYKWKDKLNELEKICILFADEIELREIYYYG